MKSISRTLILLPLCLLVVVLNLSYYAVKACEFFIDQLLYQCMKDFDTVKISRRAFYLSRFRL